MRRQLLLTGMVCAVAIAVLLRTVASDVEPLTVAAQPEPEPSVVPVLLFEDCTITPEQVLRLGSSDAIQSSPPPWDAVDVAVALRADQRSVATLAEVGVFSPGSLTHASLIPIRPPPVTPIA